MSVLEEGIVDLLRTERSDALIAATALVHGLTVVTRDRRDVEGTGVATLDPWMG